MTKTKDLIETNKQLSELKSEKQNIMHKLEKDINEVLNISGYSKHLKILINPHDNDSLILELKQLTNIKEKELSEIKKLLGFKKYDIYFNQNEIKIKFYDYEKLEKIIGNGGY